MSDRSTARERARAATMLDALRFAAGYWNRQRARFGLIFGLTMVATLLDLAAPIVVGVLIDAVASPNADPNAVWRAVAVFAAIVAAASATRAASTVFVPRAYTAAMEAMTNEAFARVQRFSTQWHADTFAGKTVREISRAMWAFDQLSDAGLFGLAPTAVLLLGAAVYLLVVQPVIGVFAIIAIGAFLWVTVVLNTRWAGPVNEVSNTRDSAVGAALADVIGANAVVKSFGAEAREEARFARALRRWRTVTQWAWSRFIAVWWLQLCVLFALQIGLAGLMVSAWAAGRASAGDVAAAIALFLVMSGYLRTLGEHLQATRKALDEMKDAAAIMQTPASFEDADAAPALSIERGEIVFDAVTFAYPATGRRLFDGLNVTIEPGQTVALVGATGSGKSSFVKLLQRLYDVDAGAVRIDGQDVRDVDASSVRAAVASVAQDPIMFHRSLAENIAYARPNAPIEDVIAAAVQARAHDFITRLPEGYRTPVGERGVKLSGGERQRVAIARAFLADQRILVLDEATSSLDVETEREVQAAMAELSRDRTTLIVAHRLSTVRAADRILVFSDGRIIEDGDHDTLMRRPDGVYRRLAGDQEVLAPA